MQALFVNEALEANRYLYRGIHFSEDHPGIDFSNLKLGTLLNLDNGNPRSYEKNNPRLQLIEIVKNAINPNIPNRSTCSYFSGDKDYAASYAWEEKKVKGWLTKLVDFEGSVWYNKNITDFLDNTPTVQFSMTDINPRVFGTIKEHVFDFDFIKKYQWPQSPVYGTPNYGSELVKLIKWYAKYFNGLEQYHIGDKTFKCEYFLHGKHTIEIVGDYKRPNMY